MTAVILLRVFAVLRRISRNLNKANEIAQQRLDLEKDRLALQYPQWYRAGGRVPDSPKLTEIAHADVEDWNRKAREVDPYVEDRRRRP